MIATCKREPVTFLFAPASESDINIFKIMSLEELPSGAVIYGDKAYNDYEEDDLLKELEIHLFPARRKFSKRPLDGPLNYL